jgi:hypothetical protein
MIQLVHSVEQCFSNGRLPGFFYFVLDTNFIKIESHQLQKHLEPQKIVNFISIEGLKFAK